MIPGLEKACSEYEAEYRRWFVEGESKPIGIGMPRLLESPGARTGMVLVHGYMAAPEEVALLGRRIQRLGITVYLPRLPGHGTSPCNLAATGRQDWKRAVAEACDLVLSLCDRVVLAGFSMGAGLALGQAESGSEGCSAVISISAPLRLKNALARLAGPLARAKAFARKTGLKRLGYDFFANHPDNPEINYRRNCVHGTAELRALMSEVRIGLPSIRAPILVLQGSRDRTVARSSPAIIVRDSIRSERRSMAFISSDSHGIVRGPALDDTFAAIRGFLVSEGFAALFN
jgi:esterase/lipase